MSCSEIVLEAISREELIGIAVARGCYHYAGFSDASLVEERPDLPHEVLGCALLRGPADVDTFKSIRVGAMVLSDLGNDPSAISAAAIIPGVEGRVAHIARVALNVGDRPDFWQTVLKDLPPEDDAFEAAFLPGITRFRTECPKTSPGRCSSFVWLRTSYERRVH